MRALEAPLDQPWAQFAPPPAWVVAFRAPAGRQPGELVIRREGSEPPQRAERTGCVVCFAGVLENREALSASPHDQADDADIVLDRYLHAGAECIDELRGSFALAIWDGSHEQFLCARDRMGISPLFYAEAADELLLSISTRALLAEPGVDPALDRLALAERVCLISSDRERTYFSSIRRVPAGCALRVRPGGRQLYRHWNPVVSGPGRDGLGADAMECFRVGMDQAAERALRRGRAGIFLSGGIDSVSIAATALEQSRRLGLPPPLALSLAFRYPGFDSSRYPNLDESEEQRAVAGALAMPQLSLELGDALGDGGLVSAAVNLSAQMPAPLDNFWMPAYRSLAIRGREEGCAAIITGSGGDEWLGVAPELTADLIRSGRIIAALALWHKINRSNRLPLAPSLRVVLWECGVRPLLAGGARSTLETVAPRLLERRWKADAERSFPAWVAPDPGLRRELEERAMELRREPRPRSHYEAACRRCLDHPLVAMELEESFENGRDLGVPIVHPFLDSDLVDLLYRLPPEAHFVKGRDKGLARAMVTERFPQLGFARKRKVAATSFVQAVFAAESPEVWKSLGPARALAELEVVDAKLLQDDLSAGFALPDPGVYALCKWASLSAEAWARSQREGTA